MMAKPDWLDLAVCKKALNALGADKLRFVGGCVRDTLLNIPVVDIDACTPLLPERVMTLLEVAGIKVIPTGIEHGTVTAFYDGRTVEITTLREDIRPIGNRHADVAFTDDWDIDALRRDLTMNAIYMDGQGDIYDPLNGLGDLKAGIVRFIGDAEVRIGEDALRILRFFRFYAHYGQGEVDEGGLRACEKLRESLMVLSIERVRDELFKILYAPDPSVVLTLMERCGILDIILPEALSGIHSVSNLQDFIAKEQSAPVPVARLIALLPLTDKVVTNVSKRLKLSKKEQAFMRGVIAAVNVYDGTATHKSLRALYYHGRDMAYNGCMLAGGDVEVLLSMEMPIFSITGKDLMDHGMKAGPQMGAMLKGLETEWLDSAATLSRDDLLSKV